MPTICTICGVTFHSRNKLFAHLRQDHSYDGATTTVLKENLTAEQRTAASLEVRSAYQNKSYEVYYTKQSQEGVFSLDSWKTALEYFRRPLPVAYRLCREQSGHGPRKEFIRKLRYEGRDIFTYSKFFDSTSCMIAIKPEREWPSGLQDILGAAQDVGAVNRQELCSMIPPQLLLRDFQASEKRQTIIDLCCAPGSKTLQVLDMVKKSCTKPFNGMVVANDSNRLRLLTVAQRARLAEDKSFLVLNSSDGCHFPALRKWGGYKLKFDYVLADVPCSGDGTLRKMSSKGWQKWNVKHHLSLHKLQLRLLVRSLQLVKKGGRVVYSTCSLDPLENEAVVASAIARMGGPSIFRIVKAPEFLVDGAEEPFTYSPGATSWAVPDPEFSATDPNVYHRHYDVPEKLKLKEIVPSMFPPHARNSKDWEYNLGRDFVEATTREARLEQLLSFGDLLTTEGVQAMETMLPHCCRILPQHLDSGGFFTAIIERAPAQYFAVCCPGQRAKDPPEESHHGRIYLVPEESDQILLRKLIKIEGIDKEEIFFEGLPTLGVAQNWLKSHDAYVETRSDGVSPLPQMRASSQDEFDRQSKPGNSHRKLARIPTNPTYTAMFRRPHQKLLEEFVDYFGLQVNQPSPLRPQVGIFPLLNLAVTSGDRRASEIESYLLPSEAFVVTNKEGEPFLKKKFFQLSLISDEIRTLFSGGAKFNPMEVGTTICAIPIPAIGRQGPTQELTPANEFKYALYDEGAETLGPYATRRLVTISPIELDYLFKHLEIPISYSADDAAVDEKFERWLNKVGYKRFHRLGVEAIGDGAVIIIAPMGEETLYLSGGMSGQTLHLLTKKRCIDAWKHCFGRQ